MRREKVEFGNFRIQITWGEGRTPVQKRKIAERITQVFIEEAKSKRENIHVAFHDLPETNYANAGVLVVDRKRTREENRRIARSRAGRSCRATEEFHSYRSATKGSTFIARRSTLR